MAKTLEVCIDNLESLHLAITGGASRIELCSSLALGGLTPSYGFMKKAAELSSIPVYAMIRPRQGDFLYSSEDIEAMMIDIHMAKQAGLQGVVFGVLDAQGNIDMPAARALMAEADQLGVTFHRAIDQCRDYRHAMEDIAQLKCERILTSGLAPSAEQGISVITEMVKLANGRFSVMAGAGVNINNASKIMNHTGISEIHLSGKTTRPSHMQELTERAKMGDDSIDDFVIPITNSEIIKLVKTSIE